MPKNYKVYQHTFPNGKKYIGITCQEVKMRWRRDGKGYKSQQIISNAIKKYGWENVSHDILYSGLSKGEARYIEKQLIEELGLTDRSKGYNYTPGGDLPPRTDRPVYCIEDDIVYPSISEAARRTGIDFHQIQWACAGLKRSITVHGKHWCFDSDRKSIEEIEARRQKSGRKGVRVRCVETGEIYESAKAASEAAGGHCQGNISGVCRGTYKAPTYMGYHWEYVDPKLRKKFNKVVRRAEQKPKSIRKSTPDKGSSPMSSAK